MNDVTGKTDEEMAAEISPAIQTAINGDIEEGELVTRWILVAETVSASGERDLIRLAPEGTEHWEAAGLLSAASDMVTWPWEEPEDDE
jgi:hypothetical protein